MNPREFCKIAGRFAAQGEPAACRSAISRAYYSLFHVILEFLLSRNVPLPKKRAECHEKLYQLLYNSGSDILRTVGSELNDLRSRRNDADYRSRSPVLLRISTPLAGERALCEVAKTATLAAHHSHSVDCKAERVRPGKCGNDTP